MSAVSLRHVGAGDAHRHADVGALQGGRIVHAVARHRHDLPARPERFDDAHLVLRADARKHVGVLDGLDQRRIVHLVESRPRREPARPVRSKPISLAMARAVSL